METSVKARSGEADYRLNVRAAVRGLWRGEIDLFGFVDAMRAAIENGFTRAWHEGAEECDVYPEEMAEEETDELKERVNDEILFTLDFGHAIEEGNRENGGLLRVQLARAEKWVKRYRAIRNRAMVMACGDRKLKWVYSPEAQHCGDCIRLDGQIRRASVWRDARLEPQSPRLECVRHAGGVSVCKCHFEETDEPCTRGRIPLVAG